MSTILFCFIFVFAVAINAANGSPKGLGISQGRPVLMVDYPYQAELQRYGKHHCGGSIISEQYVLTAAHCLSQYYMDKIEVRVGSRYVDKGGQFFEVVDRFIHPQYNFAISDNDVGIVKLSSNIKVNNKTTKVVQLAGAGVTLSPGDNITISGWGQTKDNGLYAKVLRAVEVPILPQATCDEKYWRIGYTDSMFCAGLPEGGKDSCVGDSGGPAVHVGSGLQYGVISWGHGCGRTDFPGVYASIPAVRDWITQVTGV